MPKCPKCGHDYISGELHCPECFEPVPIVTVVSNQPASAGQHSPDNHEVNHGTENEGDPFDGLFNHSPKTASPIQPVVIQQTEFTDVIPPGPVNTSEPVSGLANNSAQPEQVQVSVAPDPQQWAPLPVTVLGSQAQPRAALLRVIHGQDAGTEFVLTPEPNMIGRWDPDIKAFVQVDLTAVDVEVKVSRKHAQITCSNGEYFIEDLGSANGTYINRGERLIPGNNVPLNDGDEIIMGKTFLKFILG